MVFDIEEELKKLPAQPGVYLMHDAKDEIIYVGKAVSLKNRVRQYFQSSRNKTAKIEQMVSRIARFEYIITDSEMEALVLECNLIKEYRPKYNTMLKDDKSYPYIRRLSETSVCPYHEAGQKPVLWSVYQLWSCKRYPGSGVQAVSDPYLPEGASQRRRKRAAMFKLPHQTVPGSLSGLHQQGRVQSQF